MVSTCAEDVEKEIAYMAARPVLVPVRCEARLANRDCAMMNYELAMLLEGCTCADCPVQREKTLMRRAEAVIRMLGGDPGLPPGSLAAATKVAEA